ncbi:hypothetical protein PR08_gp42 [Idiomarinaceae phage Phi1M2-2]|nr:hypothetical protein PR08_gp42 [Idiomarinaceae phage Phi1M2-2]AIM40799.1 hypothetical protein M22_042 [Idiomarinaceae phage Phi1M2-2]
MRKHTVSDAIKSTLIYGAIAVVTYWFIVGVTA